jgi:3-methyladenine DNA glycosylase AlkD
MTRPFPTLEETLEALNALADPSGLSGMARFGIRPARALGISMPKLRSLAKGKRCHPLAQQLWQTGIHEARILASMIADPSIQTVEEMDAWVADFDSWDVCDQVCVNLFVRSKFAVDRALAWAPREPEFVRRAGFVMMAVLAVHAKKMPDEAFFQFFPVIVQYACDDRNFVKKAVNWALRGIGKRSPVLCEQALLTAAEIYALGCPAARWNGADARRELEGRCQRG